jgi:hypothetical protein
MNHNSNIDALNPPLRQTHVMPPCLSHGSLFSGIGGFDLAAQWMGWNNIFQVEKDDWCRKVLAKNFPKTERFADIKDFTGHEYTSRIDVISGGFPCQPFSVAGQRKGKDDDRYLWEEMLRVIATIKPMLLAKMLLASSAWHSTRCYLTWKHRTTPQKRLLFQLAVKTPGTDEIGSGLWLTPTASDGKMSKKKTENLYVTENGTIRLRNKAGSSSNAGLANQVLFFPTPRASSAMNENMESIRNRGKYNCKLEEAIAFLPTPTTQDAKNNGSQSQMERNSLPLNAVAGGKLNPEWVEWLMGYPVGWTDLKD